MSVIGVDLGGTGIRAGLVTDGAVRHAAAIRTPAQDGPEAIVAALLGLVDRVRGDARRAGLPPARGIGIGSAGVIDPGTGTVLTATDHLRGWAGTPLGPLVTTRTGLPVRVINDVHAHALGEARYGAGAGRDTVLLIAAGTGLGGSLVLHGTPLTGRHHVAGHLGHVPCPEADGLPCSCGATGHLEAVASGTGLHDLARRAGLPVADAAGVSTLAASGDRVAQRCLATTARALGRAIGGWANTLDPDVVIVTGGLASCGDAWWRQLREAARSETVPAITDLRVVPAAAGPDAALLGAATLLDDTTGGHG